MAQKRDDLNPSQQQELTELVDDFSEVFSVEPGLTHLVEHKIKTLPGVVARQRPYQVSKALDY